MARRTIPGYQNDFLEGPWGSLDLPIGSYDKVTALPLPGQYNINRMDLYINDVYVGSKFAPFTASVIWDFKPSSYPRTSIPKVYYFDNKGNMVYVSHIATTEPADTGVPGVTTINYDMIFSHGSSYGGGATGNVLHHVCLNSTTGAFKFTFKCPANTGGAVADPWAINGVQHFPDGSFYSDGTATIRGPYQNSYFIYGLFLQTGFLNLTRWNWDINKLKPSDYDLPGNPSPRTLFDRYGILVGAYDTATHYARFAYFNPRWKPYYNKWYKATIGQPLVDFSRTTSLIVSDIDSLTSSIGFSFPPTGSNKPVSGPLWNYIVDADYRRNLDSVCGCNPT
jgi:hypothetical protein